MARGRRAASTAVDELLELGTMLERDWLLAAEARVGARLAAGLLRVRERSGRMVPLRANAVQAEYERRRGERNIVLKARQMGLSTWIAGRFFLKTITTGGVLTVQVAQTREASEGLFRMAQRMWECLPAELRDGPLRRGRANVGQMTFPLLDSEFRVLSAADGSAGRGLTMQNLHCSEVSRWPGDAAATLAGLRAALAPGGEECLESTANGAYGCFYEEWCGDGRTSMPAGDSDRSTPHLIRGASANETGHPEREDSVVRHFFPWWMEPGYVGVAVPAAAMSEAEAGLVARYKLSGEQIGFRRGLERSYRGLRAQEFAEDAESCFKATGACCFDVEALDKRLSAVPEPVARGRGGALLVWLPAMAGREYLCAVDTAGGGEDGDFCCVQVIDVVSGMQCAELRERLGPLELAHVAAELGREYGQALMVVERNNHGATVLAYLSTVERYGRVYGEGWLTTSANKPEVISGLGALLVERPELFRSGRLLGECRTFVAGAGGKAAAASGCHDDCVMAMAIGQAVRAELVVGRKA